MLSGTHKDLKSAVANGSFGEDLFYRLNVVPIRVPALRERPEDIPLLVSYFSRQIAARNNFREKEIDEEVLWELKRYRWPGNVRELQNILERMIIMSDERVGIVQLPDEFLATPDDYSATGARSLLKEFRDRAERSFILGVVRKHKGNGQPIRNRIGRRPVVSAQAVRGVEDCEAGFYECGVSLVREPPFAAANLRDDREHGARNLRIIALSAIDGGDGHGCL